jgi:hypothetical protein
MIIVQIMNLPPGKDTGNGVEALEEIRAQIAQDVTLRRNLVQALEEAHGISPEWVTVSMPADWLPNPAESAEGGTLIRCLIFTEMFNGTVKATDEAVQLAETVTRIISNNYGGKYGVKCQIVDLDPERSFIMLPLDMPNTESDNTLTTN